jgi:hypothetical protein
MLQNRRGHLSSYLKCPLTIRISRKRQIQIAMQLTSSQIETFRKIEKDLLARKQVLLIGESNGKSALLQEFLTRFPADPPQLPFRHRSTTHPHLVCLRVYLHDGARIRPEQAMRQILRQLGLRPAHEATQTIKAFTLASQNLERQGRVIAVMVDGAELLSARGIAVLKVLNSFRDTTTNEPLGPAILLPASKQLYRKLPLSFVDRCKVRNLSRIASQDLSQFAEQLYPGISKHLTQEILDVLDRCQTTLQIKSLLEQVNDDRLDLRLERFDRSMLEDALSAQLSRRAA